MQAKEEVGGGYWKGYRSVCNVDDSYDVMQIWLGIGRDEGKR